jgi:hypothetical protein
MTNYLIAYLITGLALGVCLLLWGYIDEWIVRYYERFHMPKYYYENREWRTRPASGKKIPDWVWMRHNSPERGKLWVVWVFAGALAIPVVNVIVGTWFLIGVIKEKLAQWEHESLEREKNERHAICKQLVEEYESSPAARKTSSTNGRNVV